MGRKRDNLEYKVLQTVKKSGDEGILQSQLWKEMKATSREGSRISLKLERAGLIFRHRVLHNGKWTFKLIAKKRPVTIGSISDLPCVFCVEQNKCGVGGIISPNTCSNLTEYMDIQVQNSNFNGNLTDFVEKLGSKT